MKAKRLTTEQMEKLRKALAPLDSTQLQELRSYLNGLISVAMTKPRGKSP